MANLWKASLMWGNPFTNPPNNQPRILLEVLYDASTVRVTELPEIQELLIPGNGYALTLNKVFEEQDNSRKWTKQRKAETRQRNLRRRIEKQLNIPEEQLHMFNDPVEEMFQAEIKKKPDYYAGGDKHIEEERKRAEKRKVKLQEYRDKQRYISTKEEK